MLNTYTISCSIYRLCILQHSTVICSVGFSQSTPFTIPNSSMDWMVRQCMWAVFAFVLNREKRQKFHHIGRIVRPSVRVIPARLPLAGFVSNFTLETFMKIRQWNPNLANIRQKYWQLYAKHELSTFTLLTAKKYFVARQQCQVKSLLRADSKTTAT